MEKDKITTIVAISFGFSLIFLIVILFIQLFNNDVDWLAKSNQNFKKWGTVHLSDEDRYICYANPEWWNISCTVTINNKIHKLDCNQELCELQMCENEL